MGWKLNCPSEVCFRYASCTSSSLVDSSNTTPCFIWPSRKQEWKLGRNCSRGTLQATSEILVPLVSQIMKVPSSFLRSYDLTLESTYLNPLLFSTSRWIPYYAATILIRISSVAYH